MNELDFSKVQPIEHLLKLMEKIPFSRLRIVNCAALTDAQLKIFLKNSSNLESLSLINCQQIKGKDLLINLEKHTPNIKNLFLVDMKSLAIPVEKNYPILSHLTLIHIQNCPLTTELALIAENLTHLELQKQDGIELLLLAPNLKVLAVREWKNTSKIVNGEALLRMCSFQLEKIIYHSGSDTLLTSAVNSLNLKINKTIEKRLTSNSIEKLCTNNPAENEKKGFYIFLGSNNKSLLFYIERLFFKSGLQLEYFPTDKTDDSYEDSDIKFQFVYDEEHYSVMLDSNLRASNVHILCYQHNNQDDIEKIKFYIERIVRIDEVNQKTIILIEISTFNKNTTYINTNILSGSNTPHDFFYWELILDRHWRAKDINTMLEHKENLLYLIKKCCLPSKVAPKKIKKEKANKQQEDIIEIDYNYYKYEKNIKLNNHNDDLKNFELICLALSFNKNIATLEATQCQLTNFRLYRLLLLLRGKNLLSSIDLSDNQITDEALSIIVDFLNHTKSIHAITLKSNNLSRRSLELIDQTIKSKNRTNNNVYTPCIFQIKPHLIQVDNLSENNKAKLIPEMKSKLDDHPLNNIPASATYTQFDELVFLKYKTLFDKSLILKSFCTDKSFEEKIIKLRLVEIMVNEPLSFSLSGISIEINEAKILAEAFKTNNSLIELSMNKINNLTGDILSTICMALFKHQTLSIIDLTSNNFSSKDCIVLGEFLTKNLVITKIIVDETIFTKDFRNMIFDRIWGLRKRWRDDFLDAIKTGDLIQAKTYLARGIILLYPKIGFSFLDQDPGVSLLCQNDNYMDTAFTLACQYGYFDILTWLLKELFERKISIRSALFLKNRNKLPIEEARDNGHYDIYKFLQPFYDSCANGYFPPDLIMKLDEPKSDKASLEEQSSQNIALIPPKPNQTDEQSFIQKPNSVVSMTNARHQSLFVTSSLPIVGTSILPTSLTNDKVPILTSVPIHMLPPPPAPIKQLLTFQKPTSPASNNLNKDNNTGSTNRSAQKVSTPDSNFRNDLKESNLSSSTSETARKIAELTEKRRLLDQKRKELEEQKLMVKKKDDSGSEQLKTEEEMHTSESRKTILMPSSIKFEEANTIASSNSQTSDTLKLLPAIPLSKPAPPLKIDPRFTVSAAVMGKPNRTLSIADPIPPPVSLLANQSMWSDSAAKVTPKSSSVTVNDQKLPVTPKPAPQIATVKISPRASMAGAGSSRGSVSGVPSQRVVLGNNRILSKDNNETITPQTDAPNYKP